MTAPSVEESDSLATWLRVQEDLQDAAAQANVMGGVAERITLQGQSPAMTDADGWACGTPLQQSEC